MTEKSQLEGGEKSEGTFVYISSRVEKREEESGSEGRKSMGKVVRELKARGRLSLGGCNKKGENL